MSRWFRFYDCALDDPKVQRLSDALFKTWINLLCVASRNGGRLPAVEDLAFMLRLSEDEMAASLDKLTAARLLDEGDTGMSPHNWDERQFKSDVSSERVKRFRQRSTKRETDVSETPPETDTESDTDTEKEEAAASSLAAAAEKSEGEELAEIAGQLEDATGWVLPGVHLLRDLTREGHDLAGRILPLAREEAEKRRRLNKGRPESWALIATIVRDNYREPLASVRAAQALVKISQADPLWSRASAKYQAATGKRCPVVDGFSWFRPEFVPPADESAA
jgi:rubrerythrin